MSTVFPDSSACTGSGKGLIRSLVFAVAVGFSGVCVADPAAIQRCRQESDSLLRLRCYDAIPLPATTTGADAARQAVPPAQGQATPALGAAASATTGVAADRAANFGFENQPQPQQAPRPDSIESVIPGRFDGWVRGSRFRLANGQVWEVRDNSQGTYDLRDPKVRISRGVSGSFFMEVAGVSQTPRVRRVE
jgi:hypothetical protein